MNPRVYPALQALLAAVLFGASAPLSKLLLSRVQPVPLAAFLYLGSGLGAFLMLLIQRVRNRGQRVEAHLSRGDLPWLGGALLAGGIGAPIILLLGLERTPASTTSLLLNFEGVATTLIAITFFKESIDRRITWAIGLVTLASIVLTWTGGNWGFSLGALGIIGACFLWGVDNNFTHHISAKNPLIIVGIKGLGAGTFSLVLCLILRQQLPALNISILAMLLGSISYGISIHLFIVALRSLGAARTSTLFGVAPFVGVILSLVLLREKPQILFWAALPVMVVGAWLMITENHAHYHIHEPMVHDHRHSHPDEHHTHDSQEGGPLVNGSHSHVHSHERLEHAHAHSPDLHHQHEHETKH
ncbi:MAG: EamA family transporter [Anaerolineales bacterium]|jgi:drug/metabolite transporter (DMT)-like permease